MWVFFLRGKYGPFSLTSVARWAITNRWPSGAALASFLPIFKPKSQAKERPEAIS
jgi:hypothetical protein